MLEVFRKGSSTCDDVSLTWDFTTVPYTCSFNAANRLVLGSSTSLIAGPAPVASSVAAFQIFFNVVPLQDIIFGGLDMSFALVSNQYNTMVFFTPQNYSSVTNTEPAWTRLYACFSSAGPIGPTAFTFCNTDPTPQDDSNGVILRAGVTYGFSVAFTFTWGVNFIPLANSTEGTLLREDANVKIFAGRYRTSGIFSGAFPSIYDDDIT